MDWGQAVVVVASERAVAHLFCLRLRASGVCFAHAFPTEKLEAFLAGHELAFDWLGGVPSECVYDNPKTAVVKILAGPHRSEHDHFSSLRAHYLFDSQFCNPAQAHEKGAVENLVGFVRRNALVPVQEFRSWEELNAHLRTWCERDREHRTNWPREQAALRPLPTGQFDPAVTRMAVVSNTGLVRVDRNSYSVPCAYVGQTVRVSIAWDRIKVTAKEQVIATHDRCYRRNAIVDIQHYLPVLVKKPRATKNALAVRRLGGIWDRARKRLCSRTDGYRELAAILTLLSEHEPEAVASALEQALSFGSPTLNVVRQFLINAGHKRPQQSEVPDSLAALTIPAPDLSHYDALTGGAA